MKIKKLALGMTLLAAHGACAMEMNLTDQLIEAACDNKYEQAERLLKEGANVNGKHTNCGGVSPLRRAANLGDVKVAELFFDYGVNLLDPSTYGDNCCEVWFGSSVLQYACENGHKEMVRLLLEKGALVNFSHKPYDAPLHKAVRKSHIKIVKLLLVAGADVHVKEVQAELLAIAYTNGNLAMIEFLKEAVCMLTKIKPVDLIKPSKDGKVTAIKLYMQTGISLEGKDKKYKATPLIWAANNGHKEVCEMLLEAGADPYAQNKDGMTAFDCTYKKAKPIIIAILKRSKIELPADEDYVNQQRDYARLSEYVEIIDLFSNPISLKGMCLQMLRKLIKKGQINVSAVPNLGKFGFEHVIVSGDQGTEKEEAHK